FMNILFECGTSSISLAILVCPVVYTGYNESLLNLNDIFNKPECKGTLDESVSPPVVRFTFPLNMTSACGSKFVVSRAWMRRIFADFSNIQTVNVSGVVQSHDPTTGVVTYNAELKYFYSCAYPLEYLINNTQVEDPNYVTPLFMPALGLELRTRVYVQVKATNLTAQYHVLMDRCYASISPYPTNSTFYNLFVPCSTDQMTIMYENGDSHHARFSFPVFRFLEQQNQTVSTYHLHCITRLCESSTCGTYKVSDEATTLSSVPIVTKNDNCKYACWLFDH
uniref:Si:ch211-103f14.3 n=1 Tax=Scophthalmus maximus TaxID=52904 RepID=A0A8D2ZPL2_SCOMX